jgi:hypothetical protein
MNLGAKRPTSDTRGDANEPGCETPGHGNRAHAPDEYFLIESSAPMVRRLDGMVRSYVDYLYELA